MKEKELGQCSMCYQQDVMVRYINLYITGSEGIELCHPCEMVVVEFIRSFTSRCLHVRRDAYIRVKKMFKVEANNSVKI